MSSLKQTRRTALAAMLLAVMMMLGYVETLFPVAGLPGIKIGLSNSVLMLSLWWLGVPTSFLLMLGKVLLSGVTFGSLQSMQYALAGGLLSLIVMLIARRTLRGATPIGIGVLGAVFHNVGQMAVAMLQLRTAALVYYLAILMLVGVATGCVTGFIASGLIRRLPKRLLLT